MLRGINTFNLHRILFRIFFVTIIIAVFSHVSIVYAEEPLQRIQELLHDMTALESRVTGLPGADEAASYIHNKFNEMGLDSVIVQEFPVVIPVNEGSKLEVISSNEGFEIYPLWPNDVRTPSLSPEGFEGRLVYVHSGQLSDFNGLDVNGAIVLMDFNSGDNWLNAGLLGAKAVIFIEPSETNRIQAEAKFVSLPLDLPRFWLSKGDADLLINRLDVGQDNLRVRVFSKVTWNEVVGKNVLGIVRGSDSRLGGQVVIVQANYDSMSVVPQLSPGSEQAAGLAGFIELARVFALSPPKRTVVFLATAGHGEAMAGIRAFIDNQLFVEEHGTVGTGRSDYLYKPIKDVFLFNLDLSGGSQKVGLSHRGYFYNIQPPRTDIDKKFVNIGTLFNEIANTLQSRLEGEFENLVVSGNYQLPVPLGFSSEVFTLAGGTGLAFTTLDDPRLLIDTPFDNMENFGEEKVENLFFQIQVIKEILYEFLQLPPERFPSVVNMGNCFYSSPRSSVILSSEPKGVPFAVVSAKLSMYKTLPGLHGTCITITDPSGEFRIAGLPGIQGGGKPVDIRGYLLDSNTGAILASPNIGGGYTPSFNSDRKEKSVQIPVFKGTPVMVYDLVDRGNFKDLKSFKFLHAITDLTPQPSGYFLPISPQERVTLLFMEPSTPFNISIERSDGRGTYIALEEMRSDGTVSDFIVGNTPLILPLSQLYLGHGTWSENEKLIELLKNRGIQQDLRVKLNHIMAEELLNRAQEDLKERRYDSLLKNSQAAAHLSGENSVVIKDILDDVTGSALFYLILALPFAYFAERLLFNAISRRTQMLFRLLIFGVVFLLLRWLHPAFYVSHNLYRVGAFLVAIALFLTAVGPSINRLFVEFTRSVKESFEHERRHQIDVGRFTAAIMAFLLGIANMRKRKTRTILTLITLVLLSFTVLSFISLQPHLGYVRNRSEVGSSSAPYNNGTWILIRHKELSPLPEVTGDIIRSVYNDEVQLFPRSQYIPESDGGNETLIYYGTKSSKINSAIGITHEEGMKLSIDTSLLVGRWFELDEKGTCLLSKSLAESIGFPLSLVGEGSVTMFGHDFKVIGVVDDEKYLEIKDLDGEVLSPAILVKTELVEETSTGDGMILERTYTEINRMAPSDLVFLPFNELMDLGGTLSSFLIEVKGERKDMNLDALRARLPYEFIARIGDVEKRYTPIETISMKGMENLAVPMIIVGLIVLNTMLGAVYERHQEIAIFSAVGLSPGHIGSLFFAESCVYAIVGSLLGYLLGQIGARIITLYNLLPGLSLNYSSFFTVYSILLVMGVVVISSVYPSAMASRLAVPAIERRWKMPKMVETTSELSLPFVFSVDEALGAMTFLKSIFDGMSDKSYPSGSVYKSDFRSIERDKGTEYLLEMYVHLAPYDLGINQRVELWMLLDKSRKEYEFKAILNRLTGDIPSWNRSNHPFISELRKQCLVWRTLTPELKDDYTKKGKKLLFAKGVQVSVDEMVQELAEVICPHCGESFPLSRQQLLRLAHELEEGKVLDHFGDES